MEFFITGKPKGECRNIFGLKKTLSDIIEHF